MKLQELFGPLKIYWDSEPSFATLIPGGLWWEKPKQTATIPYASMTGTESEPELTSGIVGIQDFTINITVYSMAGGADARNLQNRIATHFRRDNRINILVPNAKLLDLRPLASEFSTQETADAQEIVVAKSSFGIKLQLEF